MLCSWVPKFITNSAYGVEGLEQRLTKCANVGARCCADRPACNETTKVSHFFEASEYILACFISFLSRQNEYQALRFMLWGSQCWGIPAIVEVGVGNKTKWSTPVNWLIFHALTAYGSSLQRYNRDMDRYSSYFIVRNSLNMWKKNSLYIDNGI